MLHSTSVSYTHLDVYKRQLQTGALDALSTLLEETKALDVVTLVGLPLLVHGKPVSYTHLAWSVSA